MATAAIDPTAMAARTTIQILARLPNELLSTICSWLPTPDVRVLGHVNRWFQDFTADYLRVSQYKSGLFRLPDAVLLKIARTLPRHGHSRLARTTQQLYPLLMKALVLDDTADDKGRSLLHAVHLGDMRLAQKIVSLRADVNRPGFGLMLTRSGPERLGR